MDAPSAAGEVRPPSLRVIYGCRGHPSISPCVPNLRAADFVYREILTCCNCFHFDFLLFLGFVPLTFILITLYLLYTYLSIKYVYIFIYLCI